MTVPTATPATANQAASAPAKTLRSGQNSFERTRDGFALTGPSVWLDPAVHAVRPDLADIRLAGRVFAPHFAVAIPCRTTRAVTLMAARKNGIPVAQLRSGESFELLEMADDRAWGIATGPGLVGYVEPDAIEAQA